MTVICLFLYCSHKLPCSVFWNLFTPTMSFVNWNVFPSVSIVNSLQTEEKRTKLSTQQLKQAPLLQDAEPALILRATTIWSLLQMTTQVKSQSLHKDHQIITQTMELTISWRRCRKCGSLYKSTSDLTANSSDLEVKIKYNNLKKKVF